MNTRIQELKDQAWATCEEPEQYMDRFAELIVRECLDIAKNWEDELENANMLSESNAAGIVAYRIARQFGVKE